MTTLHHTAEHDSAAATVITTADSVASSPRSDHPSTNSSRVYDDNTGSGQQARVRFMCSFGGKILPRPHDNQLRYVGGDTRIITINRHNTSFSSLLHKLSKLSGTNDISVKYQLPNEDLDALITVTSDEDVENMMDEYDRLAHNHKSARLRLFLFPTDNSLSRASSISSLLDGSTKREHWFLDALNGGPALERGRSEVSSIVSEVPDYLFGLDHPDDPFPPPKPKFRHLANDSVSVSDPGSPEPRISSPFCSTSSSLGPGNLPPVPDLRPVRTRPDNPPPPVVEQREMVSEHIPECGDPTILKQMDHTGQPVYYIRKTPSPAPMQDMPVYYMQAPSMVPHESVPMQSIPIRAQYMQQFAPHPGQILHHQVSNMGQVYGGGMRPVSGVESYDMSSRISDGSTQPVYVGMRYVGVPGYPGMVVTGGGEEVKAAGSDAKMGRAP